MSLMSAGHGYERLFASSRLFRHDNRTAAQLTLVLFEAHFFGEADKGPLIDGEKFM